MSSYPVTGYFKQLQGYYLAKEQRVRISTQPRSANQVSDGELPSDTVELSRPVRPANCYTYLDTLTDSDKAIVKVATGWDIDADPLGESASSEARQFVGRLNLDRSCGALKGDIDQSYLSRLIQENLQPGEGQATISLSVLYKVQTYLSQSQCSSTRL